MGKLKTIGIKIKSTALVFFKIVQITYWPFVKERIRLFGIFLKPRWKRYTVVAIITGSVLMLGFTLVVFINYLMDRGDIIAQLHEQKEWIYGRGISPKKPMIKIYDRNRQLIGEYLPERGSHITMQQCKSPGMKWLRQTAVSSEDRYFYDHGGVSYKGIVRAMYNNIKSFGLREGGGTITQQLARNLYTNRERSLYRKLYETFTAYLIEDRLNKEEILCLYLNKIYMGEGRIGAEEASWFYFKKPPWRLDAAEAAMIVGLFPSPVYYNPLNNIKRSLRKQDLTLQTLVRDEQLTDREKRFVLQRFLKRYDASSNGEGDAGIIGAYGASRDFRFNAAPTANAYVKSYLYKNLPEEQVRAGGLKVFTTIDKGRQRAALLSVRATINSLRSKMKSKSPRVDQRKLTRMARRLNGVLISMDASSGDIMALVGGYQISDGNMYQRPFHMRRQPGSALKGFLYAVAMDEGQLEVNSIVEDKRFCQGKYCPRNYNGKYLGEIPLRKALAISSNSVAVRTLNDLGARVFRRRMLGAISSDDTDRFPANLTLALGSGELTPIEMAQIYAMLSNGGRAVQPRLVISITDSEGETIVPESEEVMGGDEILDQDACQNAIKLMTYVFDPAEGGTAKSIGKRRAANKKYLPFDIAGKTGTVQVVKQIRKKFPGVYGSQKDAWFVGLVPGEATIVWFGHDEGAPIGGGGVTAALAWAAYAQAALPGRIKGKFAEIEIVDPDPEDKDNFWNDWFNNEEKAEDKDSIEIINTPDKHPETDLDKPTDSQDPDSERIDKPETAINPNPEQNSNDPNAETPDPNPGETGENKTPHSNPDQKPDSNQ